MNKNENNYTNIGERQGYVSKSGYKWELEVMNFLNKEFLSNNIPLQAIHGKKIKKNSNLWDKLAIPVGESLIIYWSWDLTMPYYKFFTKVRWNRIADVIR